MWRKGRLGKSDIVICSRKYIFGLSPVSGKEFLKLLECPK